MNVKNSHTIYVNRLFTTLFILLFAVGLKAQDAIAESKDRKSVESYIQKEQPDYIVSISGFECFEEDMNEIKAIKEKMVGPIKARTNPPKKTRA